jgi:hypothetical protein
MALPAGSVWEVRPGVGSDTNGGGFVTGSSGTDYSQQNSKNTVGSDISTTDAVGNGTTTLTSATGNFSTGIVGNIIFLSGSGITTGWYQVTARGSAISITLDRSPGTGTGATMNIGGALATVSQAATNSVPSNIVYVKASGTYTVTTAQQIVLQSYASPGVPFSIIGYTSTRGDNGQFTWTTATNSVDLVDTTPSTTETINVLLQNISFTTTAGTKATCIKSSGTSHNSCMVTVQNCTINGFVIGIGGSTSTGFFNGLMVINTRITACSSHGIENGATTYLLGCMIDNNGGDGFNGTTAPFPAHLASFVFENSIFYKNGANGLKFPFDDTPNGDSAFYLVVISHCDLSTNTGAGLLFEAATDPYFQISNSIFDANGTYGVDMGSGTGFAAPFLLYNNAFYNNGTAPTLGVNAGFGTVTLTANPYTSIGTDFSLNSTAGGGTACKGAGWPGVMPGGTGHADIGALQSSGSGGTTVNVIAPTQIRILQNEGE